MKSFSTNNYRFVNYLDVSAEESLQILELRNREEIRKWMVNDEPISQANHFRFMESLVDKERCDYFMIKDPSGNFIGTVNITALSPDEAERGIFINPDFQNQGHASQSLAEFYSKLSSLGIKSVITKVKTENVASNALEKKLGACLIKVDKGFNIYRLII